MKEFTPHELATFNGKGGKPAYIAYQGKVYDVSGSSFWEDGLHFDHRSGLDLTEEISSAPHGDEVFEDFPQVGLLIS